MKVKLTTDVLPSQGGDGGRKATPPGPDEDENTKQQGSRMRGGDSDQDLPPPPPPISSPPLGAPGRRVRSMRTHFPPWDGALKPAMTTGQEAKSAMSRFSWWCSGLGTAYVALP